MEEHRAFLAEQTANPNPELAAAARAELENLSTENI